MRTYIIEDDNRKLMDKQEAINWLLNNEGKVLEKMPSGKKE